MKFFFALLFVTMAARAGALNIDDLRHRIETHGADSRAGDYVTLSLSRLDGDVGGAHRAAYISEVGRIASGAFVPGFLTGVVEDWTIDGSGNWVIDQWIYTASLEGSLASALHLIVTETPQRMLVSSKPLTVPPIHGEAMQAQWGAMLGSWAN